MRNAVVLDLETKKTFQDAGTHNPALLGVSLVGVYSYETDAFMSFREEEFSRLFRLLEQASLVIGFNINHFDLPALTSYYVGSFAKLPALDLLDTVKKVLGQRISLNALAKETLGVQKSGHGLMAINYFNEGNWEKLEKYCLDDVKITRDLYEYGKKNGKVYYMSPWGRKEVKVDWQEVSGADAHIPMTLGL